MFGINVKELKVDQDALARILARVDWITAVVVRIIQRVAALFKFNLPPGPLAA